MFALLSLLFLNGCDRQGQVAALTVKPHCLISQSDCVINNVFGKISVLFDVEKVVTEHAFNIIIKSEKDIVDLKVTGYLEGKEMFMGKIPLFFQKNDSGNYITETYLGSCSEEKMVWRMWLTFTDSSGNNNNRKETVFIDFTSSRG